MSEAVERLNRLAEALDLYAKHGGRLISQDDAAKCAADLRALKPGEGEPVGVVSLMGTDCTMATFEAAKVPVGTPLYTRPVAWPEGYKLVPVEALEEVRDLLMERRHGNPARSPGHNARLAVEFMLSPSAGQVEGEKG